MLVNNDDQKHQTFYRSLLNLDRTQTVVGLKLLILAHRIMLYCPFISPLPLESLFRQMTQKWKEINLNQIGNPKDVMRTAFSTRLIYQYAEVIVDKVKLAKDFSQIIDSAYVLKQY